MKHLLSLFLSTLLAVALTTPATAQSAGADAGIAGTYTIQDADGAPVEDGAVWEITIVPVPGWNGLHIGVVTRDEIEPEGTPDTGKQIIKGEESVIIDLGEGLHLWENLRGTTGVIAESPDGDGDLDSEVLTGPNAGTQRHFDKQGDDSGSDD